MMKKNNYDVIIFDFDDTLFDYEKTERQALKSTFSWFGIEYKDEYYDIFRRINREEWQFANQKNSQSIKYMKKLRFEKLFKEICVHFDAEEFNDKYTEFSYNGELIEHVEETIKALHKSVNLVIASNGPSTPRREKLSNSAIKNCFLAFFSSEQFDGEVKKPDAEFFLKIINTLFKSISKERILVVGDRLETDILGANNSGFKSMWFNYRRLEYDKSVATPDFIIDSFDEILKYAFE